MDIKTVLSGLIDLHCHSGPSPFPRAFDHAEGAQDGERINMRAFVAKSHHHNTVIDMLCMKDRLSASTTEVFGGIVLNNQVGGINPYAVELCLQMGGKIVWFPTFCSRRHFEFEEKAMAGGFPTASVKLSKDVIDIRNRGGITLETQRVCELVAENNAILNAGHLHPDDLDPLFNVAIEHGVERMIVSHPNFIIELPLDHAKKLSDKGVFMEHAVGMYVDKECRCNTGKATFHIDRLLEWIKVVGVEHTILVSDLGQAGAPMPVDAFIAVCSTLMEEGISQEDIRRMTVDNPRYLLNLAD